MAKNSAILEDAVDRIPIAEFTSGAREFEGTIPPPRSAFSVRHERTKFEPDNYQIALISFQDGQDRAGGTPLQDDRVGRFFLLPLTWRQLVTRVRGTLGHSDSGQENKRVQFGRVSIDFLSMEVRRSDRPVSLTAMEFKVLKFFVLNPTRVISRDQLLNEVWGYDNYPCTRTVDNHVLKLRQKLETHPADPVHFLTVYRAGYKFVP
jgi:DNA-binding winged helix-turn-helix (wHTH) protein